jgi:hypothetical protein
VGDSLEGELVKTTTGKWDIRLLPGSERPLKPKKDLAGDTISCPAMLQLEANDSASPLHRMVYATINEAAERGLFSDEGLQTNMDRIEAERLEALRMREEFVKWHNGKRARDDMVFQGTSFEMSRDYVQQ